MASGTISLSSSKAWEGEIRWSSTPNTAGNYSDVYVYAGMWKTEGQWTSSNSYTSGTIKIDGSTYNLIGYQEFRDEVCIFEDTIRVYHNDDGTKNVSISLTCNGQANTSLSGYTLSGNGTAILDNIARKSGFQVGGSSAYPLGSELEFTISNESSSFTHSIAYQCGNATGTIATRTSASKVKWTPPLSLASQNTTGTTVQIVFTLTTYSGYTAVGTSSISINSAIPDSVTPSVSITVSDTDGHFNKYGAYIQGQSTLDVALTGAGIYGSDIISYSVDFDDRVYNEESFTTEVIKGYGTITMTATVKDSRGRTGTATKNISVLQYNLPKVTNITAVRCTSTGVLDASGAYLKVVFDAVVTSLGNKNSAKYTLQYKKTSVGTWTNKVLTNISGAYSVTGASGIFAAEQNASYDIALLVEDNFASITKKVVGASIGKIWSILATGLGFAFGKVAGLANTLDMGWRIHMNGNKITGLGDPENDEDAVHRQYVDNAIVNFTTLNEVYPVGSIYLSAVATSPASLFGGTWTQLKEKFLIGAGDWFVAGDTGGEYQHTLTLDEMPRHRHWGTPRFEYDAGETDGSHPYAAMGSAANTKLYTDYSGGDVAHNNMPPYLVVYMWKRTA